MHAGIAVDIGGTKILVAHAERPHDPLLVLTRHDGGADAIVEQIAAAVETLRGAPGPLVVASPGDLDPRSGVVRYAANLPFANFDLAGALARRLGGPVSLIGDASAATVAEFGDGAGAGCDHGAYVTASTGVGMGLLVGGRLVTGHGDQAGELGHVPVRPDGVPCRCGQRGCLEAYASGRGMADRARDAGAGEGVTARELIPAWRDGDAIAGPIVEDAIDLLGRALAMIVRLLAPSVVVLGGGVLLAGGLVDAVRDRAAAVLSPNDAGLRERLRPAGHGELSALAGAAAVCRGDARALAIAGTEAGIWA